MSNSSATDQHGNWRTVPEVPPKDAIRVRAEELLDSIIDTAVSGHALDAGFFDRGAALKRIDSTLRAALAEKDAEIAELMGAMKDAPELICRRLCEIPHRDSPEDDPDAMLVYPKEVLNAVEVEFQDHIAKHTKPKGTT